MKHDIFEFNMDDMSWWDRASRVLFLVICIGILVADLFFWRPL